MRHQSSDTKQVWGRMLPSLSLLIDISKSRYGRVAYGIVSVGQTRLTSLPSVVERLELKKPRSLVQRPMSCHRFTIYRRHFAFQAVNRGSDALHVIAKPIISRGGCHAMMESTLALLLHLWRVERPAPQ